MENQEEIQSRVYELVKEKFKSSNGANGLQLYGTDAKLGITREELNKAIESLLKQKKIELLNHLNGISYTIPK